MKLHKGLATLITMGTVASLSLVPLSAFAQHDSRDHQHRQNMRNQWRDATIGAGALGVLGLVEHNNTLAIAGIAGAAYSANRYNQDRRSPRHEDRSRAEWYSHKSYTYHGHHYVRHSYRQNGHVYYKFVLG